MESNDITGISVVGSKSTQRRNAIYQNHREFLKRKRKKKKKRNGLRILKQLGLALILGSGSLPGRVPSGLCGKEKSGKVFSVSQDALIECFNRYSAKYCYYKNLKFPRR